MTKRTKFELTDEQWNEISKYLPPLPQGRGGPKPRSNRECFEGILWVLRSGARWKDLPDYYPSSSTCWRRLQYWEENEAWEKAWKAMLRKLDKKGLLKWDEFFSDGSFAPAKKGVSKLEKLKKEKVRSGWWWWTAKVFLSEASSRLPRTRK